MEKCFISRRSVALEVQYFTLSCSMLGMSALSRLTFSHRRLVFLDVGFFDVQSFDIGYFQVQSFDVQSFRVQSFDIQTFDEQSFDIQ
jgi:hypothetical protein